MAGDLSAQSRMAAPAVPVAPVRMIWAMLSVRVRILERWRGESFSCEEIYCTYSSCATRQYARPGRQVQLISEGIIVCRGRKDVRDSAAHLRPLWGKDAAAGSEDVMRRHISTTRSFTHSYTLLQPWLTSLDAGRAGVPNDDGQADDPAERNVPRSSSQPSCSTALVGNTRQLQDDSDRSYTQFTIAIKTKPCIRINARRNRSNNPARLTQMAYAQPRR